MRIEDQDLVYQNQVTKSWAKFKNSIWSSVTIPKIWKFLENLFSRSIVMVHRWHFWVVWRYCRPVLIVLELNEELKVGKSIISEENFGHWYSNFDGCGFLVWLTLIRKNNFYLGWRLISVLGHLDIYPYPQVSLDFMYDCEIHNPEFNTKVDSRFMIFFLNLVFLQDGHNIILLNKTKSLRWWRYSQYMLNVYLS